MLSKTSKQLNSKHLWKAESNCDEKRLSEIAYELAHTLQCRDRVLLEGPMGAGKTTFTRSLLKELGVIQPPEGSPTFAIAHEYDSPHGGIVHIDFYRLNHLDEIEAAGIPAYYWERPLIVISEWISLFPEFETHVLQSGRIFHIALNFLENSILEKTHPTQFLENSDQKREIKIYTSHSI